MRLARGAAAAIAGLLLVAVPAASQKISRLDLGLTFVGGVSGALDGFGAPAAAAYSFRLLRAAYPGTGAAVRLRRASDQAESDIGFSGSGGFDTASATTFCAATTCFVRTWYDQSGNARDAVKAAAAQQPAFVFSCLGTLPCAQSTAAQVLNYASVTSVLPVSLSGVGNRNSGAGYCFWMADNGINSLKTASANNWDIEATTGTVVMPAADGAFHAAAGVINGASSFLRIDGADSTAGAVTGSVAAGSVYVAFSQAGTTCSQTEAIMWEGYALTAGERIALTDNQRNYWMPLPLDTFTTPAAAYSLRKLKSTYSGPAVQLRRASDNAVQDINFLGFVPGTGSPLDVAAANVFCASTSCFISVWYDQSGNARDAVQVTAANQPAFIFNCNGTLPCARSTAPMQLATVSTFTPSAAGSLNGVAKRAAGAGNCVILQTDTTNHLYIDSTPNWYLLGLTGGPIGIVGVSGAWGSAFGVISGGSGTIRLNAAENTQPATLAVTAGTTIRTAIGSTPGCDQTEAIVWDNYALTLAERAALTANQRAYWGF